MSQRKREDMLLGIGLLLPALSIMLVVLIYPFLRSFWISFHDWNLLRSTRVSSVFVGLDNYRYILTDPRFLNSVRVTLFLVGLSVTLEIVLGFGIALLLNRDFPGKGLVRMVALLPWAIPPVVNGVMWRWILNPSYGALNGLLYSLGLIDKYVIWLGPDSALLMATLADVWKNTPFVVLLFMAGLQTIPRELYDAARVDGASRLQVLFRVTIPLVRPTLFLVTALRTIWALKTFDLIYALTKGGPSDRTAVLGYYTYIQSFVHYNLGRGAAAAYIMTAAVLVLVLLYYRLLYRKVEY